MKRLVAIGLLTSALLAVRPPPAAADLTAFLSFEPTDQRRSGQGFAFGVSLLIIGFEFEYARMRENEEKGAPGLTTGMMNGLVMTPTGGVQLYATAGGGFFRERVGDDTETNFGTNVGGGVKVSLVGSLRLRLDYRIFSLRGNPRYATPQRVYAGVNLSF
jgi:opacity protein-like surface antigen